MEAVRTAGVIGPHGGMAVDVRGRIEGARGVVILLHGRGGRAADIAGLGEMIAARVAGGDGLALVSPQAVGQTWYPRSFLAPTEENAAGVESGHAVIEELIREVGRLGVASRRVALVGFSQGACLASDHALRFGRRYGAVVALTGGVIGPPGTRFEARAVEAGGLAGTPVYLGSSDPDAHVPMERVEETGRLLAGAGARVRVERFVGAGHTVTAEGLAGAAWAIGTMLAEA
jgi:predicted esterase